MTDWEEIKRLAADFQRTQTNETLQKITERNCIDIVKKLTDLNLIELIYTCDGKEFLTPSHLLKEIEDEIYVNGGRAHLHDLAATLNVDYQHVENRAKELTLGKPDEYNLILGQLIHSNYKNTLIKQISDSMLINGELSIADFAKSMDLPSDFLLTIVREMLPKVMDDFVVSQDERTYYTTDMMDKYKSIIAGTLTAINKPTSVASILKRLDIPERIFMPIVEGLIKEGRLDAMIENRIYTPSVYGREQNEYINAFYQSNSHIGYDVLSRMDIKQPKAFLKKRFPDGIQLKTCFISPDLSSQVECLIEDSIASNSFIDISTIVPPTLDSDDIEILLLDLFKKSKQFSSSSLIFNKTNVCSLGYIATCKNSFQKLMKSKAESDLKQGHLLDHFFDGKSPLDKDKKGNQETKNATSELGGEASRKSKQDDTTTQYDEIAIEQQPAMKSELNDNFSDDEDTKPRGKRGKDRRSGAKMELQQTNQDSDDEQDGKKGKPSRKSGGGTQGREIRQKAVKKKYIPGNKGNQRKNENANDSDEDVPSKTPRSTKGRAARRGISPDRPTLVSSTNKQSKSSAQQQIFITPRKEPLIFMSETEIIDQLKCDMKSSEDANEELFEAIAKAIEEDLNSSYRELAKQVIDDFLKEQEENATEIVE